MVKRLRILLVGLTVVALLSVGCSDEYKDMTTSFQTDLCVIAQSHKDQSLSLITDIGALLFPAAELDSQYYKVGDRYLVTYIPMDSTGTTPGKLLAVSGRPVRVLEMQPVLVKPILDPSDSTGALGDDPVKLTTFPWLGGGFLNMEFKLRYHNETIKHGVFLIADSTVTRQDGATIYLTFKHNANGDGTNLLAASLVSFSLSSLPDLALADSLVVSLLEWTDNGNVINSYRLPNRVNK